MAIHPPSPTNEAAGRRLHQVLAKHLAPLSALDQLSLQAGTWAGLTSAAKRALCAAAEDLDL